jgi:hypothetical protein
MSNDETLPPPAADLTQPVYIGDINKVAVRFYPPQTSDEMMPWVAIDDLARAIGMSPNMRLAFRDVGQARPGSAKRIRSTDGYVDVVGHESVQGLMRAMIQVKQATEGVHLAYAEEAVAAAERMYPAAFDRDSGGKFRANSQMMASLLGTKHEAIVDLIEKEGIEVEAVPPSTRH